MASLQKMRDSVRSFHRNEAGLEILQVVMILAVAAVALIAVKYKWDDIKEWFNDVMGQAVGEDNWSTSQ